MRNVYEIIIIDLVLDGDEIIQWDELQNFYKNEDESNLSPVFINAYKYMKNQVKICPCCKIAPSSKRVKYVMPCYCTICEDCLEEAIRMTIDSVFEQLKGETKTDIIDGITFKKNLPRCPKHKIPYLPNRIIDILNQKKIDDYGKLSLDKFLSKCNFLNHL